MVIFFSEQDFLSGKNGPIAICCAVERLNATLFKVERLNASLFMGLKVEGLRFNASLFKG